MEGNLISTSVISHLGDRQSSDENGLEFCPFLSASLCGVAGFCTIGKVLEGAGTLLAIHPDGKTSHAFWFSFSVQISLVSDSYL